MVAGLLSRYREASKELIGSVFELDCTSYASADEKPGRQRLEAEHIFQYPIDYCSTRINLYTGFTKEAFPFFLRNSYDGFKELRNELNVPNFYTNIGGLLIFKLYNDLRVNSADFTLSFPEKITLDQLESNFEEIHIGEKKKVLILFLGYHIKEGG